MMQGVLFCLAEEGGFSLLNFKERKKPPLGFYAVADGEPAVCDDIKSEREGRFLSLYPTDEWYRRVAQHFSGLTVPREYPTHLTREEALLRAMHLIEEHTGMKGAAMRPVVSSAKADGLCYHSAPPNTPLSCAMDASAGNPAFYLYGVYHAALYRAGCEAVFTENAHRVLLSMAFFEADMLRALKRGDTSVLLKRVLKTADAYYDCVYDEGGAFGQISAAVARFLEACFFLFSSAALDDEQFLPLC